MNEHYLMMFGSLMVKVYSYEWSKTIIIIYFQFLHVLLASCYNIFSIFLKSEEAALEQHHVNAEGAPESCEHVTAA